MHIYINLVCFDGIGIFIRLLDWASHLHNSWVQSATKLIAHHFGVFDILCARQILPALTHSTSVRVTILVIIKLPMWLLM